MRIKNWMRRQLITMAKALSPVDSSRGWVPLFWGWDPSGFQADDPVSLETALTHPTVYACVTQISGDIAKLGLRLRENKKGVWGLAESPAFSPVLKRPNQFQTKQKFIENWLISKLQHGNTYVLKVRDNRRVVIAMYILDPTKIEPLVAPDGSVFYRVREDHLTRVFEDSIFPASEIIHDSMCCLFHPLVGVPPIYASNLAVQQGINMQKNSAKFFKNNSRPGGILTAPGHIKEETSVRIRNYWAENYTGDNAGKVAVLGDGIKYEAMATNAKDSDMVKQFSWSDEKICSAYKVPPYKVHVGEMPTYQQGETLDRKYYSDCLQVHIESIESLLDEGLMLPSKFGTYFEIEDLLRMDFELKMRTSAEGVQGGIYSPNEARKRFNLSPVKGGNTPYLQQQNFSLAALYERDKDNPFSKPEKAPTGAPATPTEPQQDETDKGLHLLFRKDVIREGTNEV